MGHTPGKASVEEGLRAPSRPFSASDPMSCRTDLEFITKMVDKGAIDRLKKVASTPFERCTYTRAIELLEEAVRGGKKFEFPVCIASLT